MREDTIVTVFYSRVRRYRSRPALRMKGGGEINSRLAKYQNIRRFEVLPVEFSQQTGELTPKLKVKRRVVSTKYEAQIENMYKSAE